MTEIKFDSITVRGGCPLDNGECSLIIYDEYPILTPIATWGGDIPDPEFLQKTFVQNQTIISAEKPSGMPLHTIPKETTVRQSNRNKQTFIETNIYCLFDGALDLHFHDGTFQKILPLYTNTWSSYADLWTYNKFCRIGTYKATVFGALILKRTDITKYTAKVRIIENDSINESVEPGSILAVIIKPAVLLEDRSQLNYSYTFNSEIKNASNIFYMDQHDNLINLKTTDKCYLILLTPKS